MSRSAKPSDCLDCDIENAILASVPTGLGKRHRQVFNLARRLKAIPALQDASLASLKPIVKRWHTKAVNIVRTKSFDESWSDFVAAWPKVKHPTGDDVLTEALNLARREELPPAALEHDSEAVRLLVALCFQLQRRARDKPFFLRVYPETKPRDL